MAARHGTLGKEIQQLAAFCSYMMAWIDRQAQRLKSVGIDRDVHILSGTEFVAFLDSDGYGPDKMAEVKTIVDYIFNEQVESEWQDKEEEQVVSVLVEC